MSVEENTTENTDPSLSSVAQESPPEDRSGFVSSSTLIAVTETSLTEVVEPPEFQQSVQPSPPPSRSPSGTLSHALSLSPSQTHQVLVEPLGTGIATLVTDTVGLVVKRASSVGRVFSHTKRASAPSTTREQSASSPTGLKKGIRRFVSGVGTLAANGANVATGLAGCLRDSFRCMGHVIMHPSEKPPARRRGASPPPVRPPVRPPVGKRVRTEAS